MTTTRATHKMGIRLTAQQVTRMRVTMSESISEVRSLYVIAVRAGLYDPELIIGLP